MKPLRFILALCIGVSSQFVKAQISIVSTDMALVGDTIYTATDNTVQGITIGSAGANITWDFSTTSQEQLNTTYVRAPSATPYAANFPNANLAFTNNFVDYIFVRNTAPAYTPQGLAGDLLGVGFVTDVQFSPLADQYKFPTQYGGSFSGNSGFAKTIPAASLPQVLRDSIQAALPAGVTLLQVRATYTTNFLDNIDGWGTVITPICSYPCLRQRRREYTHLLIEAQVSIFGFPSWQMVSNTRDTLINYNWLAKGTKLPVVTVGFDSTGTTVNSVTYSLIPPVLDANFMASKTTPCPGESINFFDQSVGCPTSWQWTFTGGNPASSTSQDPTNISYSAPGTYPVVLQVTRGGQNNTETKTGYITVSNPVANAGNDATICFGQNASLTATGGGTYLWSTGATTATISVSPPASSNYTVTTTNANGCTASDVVAVTVNPLPIAEVGVNDTICLGETGTLTASGGVAYLWNTGSTSATITASPAITTTYTVTVTDGNSCSASDNASIVVLSPPVAEAGVNDTICRGQSGVLNASGGVSYAWSNGAITSLLFDVPVSTRSYTVTVTGTNGCTASDNASIIVNQLPTKDLSDLTICFGSTTILDAGNPGSGFTWSTGETLQTISVSTEDEYSVTITDTKGCVNSDTSYVAVGLGLTINLAEHEFCQGENVLLNSGNPGTTHTWSTGDTTQIINVTLSGTYSVTVTDPLGCSGEDSSVVLVNPLPVADAGENDTICFGQTGFLTASGGIVYLWSSGDADAIISPLPVVTTTYTVTVTDANNCSATDDVDIVVNPLPNADAGENDTICFGETGSLTASGGILYSWSNGSADATFSESPVTTTTYTVSVTDANNCSATDDAMIVVNPLPNADAGENDTICFGQTGTLEATGGILYLWDTGDTTSMIFASPLSTENYTVTVTDNNNCSATDGASIMVNPLPLAVAGMDDSICVGENLDLTAMGGISYLWNTGDASAMINVSPLVYSTFSVTVTDANGCEANASLNVTVFALPVVSFSGLDATYCPYDGAVGLTGIPLGGTFIGDGILGNIFDPTLATSGTSVTITYKYSGQNNCTDSLRATATIHPSVNAGFTGLDSHYCLNAAFITLFGTPAGGTFSGFGVTGNHFDPSTLVVGNAYDLTYVFTDTTGCIFGDTESVTIDSLPVLSIIGLDSIYCSNDAPVTLIGSPAGGTFSGAGVIGDVFHPDAVASAPNTYIITYSYSDGNGCTDLAKANVTVENCTGIETFSLQNDFIIYPNPAQDKLFIRSASDAIIYLRLYDVTGKVLYIFDNAGKKEISISLADLSSGIYYLEIISGKEKSMRKVVVQR